MSDFKTTLTTHSERNINTGHNKPDVDLVKPLKADDGVYILGTLLKDGTAGDAGKKVRWVQGADNADLITGVFVHHQDVDTAEQTSALVRVEGTVAVHGLVAATAADGSATAAPDAAALAQLEALRIYPR